MKRSLIDITHDRETTSTLADLMLNPDNYENARKLSEFFYSLAGGNRSGKYAVKSDAVAASVVGTFTGAASSGATVTIAGIALEEGDDFAGGASAAASASALADAINESSDLNGVVVASSDAANVTISAAVPGKIGNAIQVAEASANFSFAASATALSGGTEGDATQTFRFNVQ